MNLRSILQNRRLILAKEAALECLSERVFRLDLGWPYDEIFDIELRDGSPIDTYTLKDVWRGDCSLAWRE
jgi:hypothetical protein